MPPLKTLFFGTAHLACPSLHAIGRSSVCRLTSVVTQPDRPAGRGLRLQPSPVKMLALKHGIPILQPVSARNPQFIESIRAMKPDVVVVVAYGKILPRALLDVPPLGFLNVHASILPRHRGAAPIQWAILNDDSHTGVTIMKIDQGLDTGDIIAQRITAILPSDNAESLHDRLAELGAHLLLEVLPAYAAGQLIPQPQPLAGTSYARKITRDDGRIDWTLPARQLWNQTRALVPWPGTFTHLPAIPRPILLKIWETKPLDIPPHPPGQVTELSSAGILVACGQGALQLRVVQPEGRRRMTAKEFLAGHPLRVGEFLASRPSC